MTLEDKVKIYHRILDALAKGVKLAALLDAKGLSQELALAEAKNAQLAQAAATIRNGIYTDWHLSAKEVFDDIGKAKDNLQIQIRKIESDVIGANRVVKALGYVDDVIRFAAKVVAVL